MNGAYPVVNRYMVSDLQKLGVWNRSTVDLIQADNGSISKLDGFVRSSLKLYPDFIDCDESWTSLKHLQEKYKTMWELSMKVFLTMAADRGRYVDQSQSTNIYLSDPTEEQLIAIHLFTNYLGLKTGMYYLREEAAVPPIKFTVDADIIKYVNIIDADIADNIVKDSVAETVGYKPLKVVERTANGNDSLLSNNISQIRKVGKNGRKIICNGDVCINCE